MTIEVSQEQWDELQSIVGVTHGYGDERSLLVSVTRWGSRDHADLWFVPLTPKEQSE